MHTHASPETCPTCHVLHRMTVRRLRTLNTKIPVLSWCRKCGLPALMEVVNDYEFAKRHFHMIDDQPMAHKNIHAERGGWGLHWRLDDVLRVVFPGQHQEDCWPKPPWYEYNESEGLVVQTLSVEDLKDLSRNYIDVEMRMLSELINRKPRSPDEIRELLSVDRVWSHAELAKEFEVLGFKEPFAIVIRKETGQRGSMLFQHAPRYYFSFDPDRLI